MRELLSIKTASNFGRILSYTAIGTLFIPSQVNAESSKLMLEEVIVTAQKRTESLQDVPAAVSALSGDDLLNTGFRDVSDVAAQVPSLIITTNSSPLNTSFRTRRVGNEGNIPTFEPDTALIIDGAFKSRSGLGLGDLVDVEAVEVLKGPQSTLYGKNAGAGVISVSTKAPSDEQEGMLEVSGGNYDYQQVRGSLNIPFTDNFAGRFSISGTKRGDTVENLVGPDLNNNNGIAARVQLRYDFNDSVTSRLILGRIERDMHPQNGDVFYSDSQIAIIERAGGQVKNNKVGDRIVEQSAGSSFDQTADEAIFTVDILGDGYSATSITSYEDYDAILDMQGSEQNSLDLGQFRDRQAGTSFSQELRLASETASDFNWLAGAFYYHNEFTRGDKSKSEHILNSEIEEYGGAIAEQILGAPGIGPLIPVPLIGAEGDTGDYYIRQDTDSFGLFFHGGYSLTESVELAAGIRYSYEEKFGKIDQSNNTSIAGCGPTNSNVVCRLTPNGNNFSGTNDWSALTGDLTLTYYLPEGSMIYALASKGFKAGGFSLDSGQNTPENRPFDQEDISNLEIGWKAEIWDQRARVNGAIFHTTYEDFQNASFLGLVFFVNNAEKVVVDGIEIETELLLTQSLNLKLNVAYIDATYDRYTGGQCFYGRTPDPSTGLCDLSGENLPVAPKLTSNMALQYQTPLFGGDLYARLDYRYSGDSNVAADLDPRHIQESYFIGNFRIGWRDARYDISGWVKNIEDIAYFIQKAPANIATPVDQAVGSPIGSFQTFTNDQRTFGATARIFF